MLTLEFYSGNMSALIKQHSISNQPNSNFKGNIMTESTQDNTAATEDNAPVVKRNTPFHFRSNGKDEKGNTIKRETVNLLLSYPTVHGLVDIFNAGGKGLDKLVNLVSDAIDEHVRNVLTENPQFTSANFPYELGTWEAYVNVPETERKLRGIAKEVWAAFRADYIAVITAATGKDQAVIEKGAKLMIDQRFSDVKSNKKALGKLAEYLTIYAEKSTQAENFADCVTTLYEKADALLKADSDALADNI